MSLVSAFTNIGNAIRAKTGKSTTLTPAQMVTEIGTLSINPETCSTVAELEAKYTASNNGKIYKYTGTTTGDYVNGDLYEIYEINYLRVGGRIFYINTSATGATYTFYDSSYNEITDISVSGLANAYYYTKSGTGSADKFYVADSTNGLRIYDDTNYCMWASASEDLSSYSSVIDVLSSVSQTVGTGKSNTAWYLANRYNSTYYPAHNSVSGSVTCWDFAKTCNDNRINGCNDWFVPSIGEITQLRQSGIWGSDAEDWVDTTKYGSNLHSVLWSSSAHPTSNIAWYWLCNTSGADGADVYFDRNYQANLLLIAVIRSF